MIKISLEFMSIHIIIFMNSIHKTQISVICNVTFALYLFQKRNQKWRSLEKRSDVKHTAPASERQENVTQSQEEKG